MVLAGPVLAGPAELGAAGDQVDLAGQLKQIDGLMATGKFQAALTAARQAVSAAADRGEAALQATALLRESDALYYLGRRAETLAPMEQALALYQAVADTAGIGRTYYSLAYYYERTEPARMLDLLAEGKRYAAAVDDKRLLMNIANAAGVARWNQGDYDVAQQHFEESAALAREREDDPALASANHNLGLIDYHRGDGKSALVHYRQALAALEQAGNQHSVAVVLGNMGNAYLALGDPEQGLACYDRALTIDRASQYQRGIATQLENLAGVNYVLGHIELARDQYQEALDIGNQLGDARIRVYTESELGLLAQEAGRTAEASRRYGTALALARDFGDPYALIDPLRRLAELRFQTGDVAAGWEYLREAESCADTCGATYPGGILAGIRGRQLAVAELLDEAIEAYEEAIARHEATHTRTSVFLWRAALADLHRRQGDTVAAREQYLLSLAAIEDLDALIASGDFRRYLFDQAAGVYRDFAAWLAATGDVRGAWRILDRGRARDLSFRLRQHARISAPEQAALDRLATLQKRLREESLSTQETDELRHWIAAAEAQYDRTRWVPPTGSARADTSAGDQPDPGSLVVMYSVRRDTLSVFSVWRGQYHLRRLPAATALLQRCAIFGDLVSDPASGRSWRPASRALGSLLLAPEMAGRRPDRVVILPDGDLWRLPFTALTLDDGSLLATGAAVSLAPALRTLDDIARRPLADQRAILAVACTSDGRVGLPAAAPEARLVAGRGSPAVLLVDQGEGAFKAQDLSQVQIIHFASHILADLRQPHGSGIELGADQDNDGVLRAREIYRLPLAARLTVVSGCRSGDGGTVSGEGLLGLSHALLSAGSRSVVLSRWDLADRGAAFFMANLYDALRRAPVDAALMSARKACLESRHWSHPAYWATYFVAGDGSQKCVFAGRRRILGFVLLGCGVLIGGMAWRFRFGRKETH